MIGRKTIAIAASVAALILSACQPAPPPPPPPPSPPALGPQQSISERTLLTEATDIAFPSGGFALKPAGKKDLNQIVPTLKSLPPGSKVVVYGYTDNTPVGPALQRRGIVDNLDLSSKRANAVVRYLISQGVDPNIISAKGRGDTHPVASNDTPEGRTQNRRIEVVTEQPAA